jgi:hypothetical protein
VEDLPVLQVIRLKILTQSKAVGQLRSGFEARFRLSRQHKMPIRRHF